MIEPERITELTGGTAAGTPSGSYVLYWMQASQRAEYNHALEFSIAKANELEVPLVVCFGLTADYPEANLRHYTFMLEGLAKTERALRERGVLFVLRLAAGAGGPWRIAAELGKRAALIVTDRGYLRHQRRWREELSRKAAEGGISRQGPVPVFEIEADVVVPVEAVSGKREYAARTIRPKLTKLFDAFSAPPLRVDLKRPSVNPATGRLLIDGDLPMAGGKGGSTRVDLTADPASLLKGRIDETVAPVSEYSRGGTSEAKRRLRQFIAYKLPYYHTLRNNPGLESHSGLRPYLHFGQISPIYIIREVRRAVEAAGCEEMEAAAEVFIEELFIRRELSVNYVYFEPDYDRYEALPDWTKKSLAEHAGDKRPVLYSRSELEAAATGDDYWNAAMEEMLRTGTMHNYMRMYWGKKVLEWSRSPEEAFDTLLALNNKYFLDGRDPNSFAGVAWCFGNHDRPWQEREIFGKVRYMNKAGLKRKFDMDEYLRRVGALTGGDVPGR